MIPFGENKNILPPLWGQVVQFCLAIFVSLFILNLFVLLYCHSGVHVRDKSGATDYRWEPYQWKTTLEEGFTAMRMDVNGYNNRPQDCRESPPDILLMGSSQVEGVHVRQSQALPSLLNERFPEYHTYSIGVSGHTIYHCMNNLQAAYSKFRPKRYIFLVTDTIELTERDMTKVISGNWVRIPSYDSGLFYRIQKIAPAVKMLYKKLVDWHQAGKSSKHTPESCLHQNNEFEDFNDILWKFLGIAENILCRTQCQLVIIYQPPTKIDRRGNYLEAEASAVRENFGQVCLKLGIGFIDMTASFKQLYHRKNVLAHGFANTAVGAGHLNAEGYQVIANSIVDYLSQE